MDTNILRPKKSTLQKAVDTVGIPCLIIAVFFVVLLVLAASYKMNILSLIGEILRRWGMNGVLVLAMVPSIQCGIGLNFGVSLGIVSGLFGSLVAIEIKLVDRPMFAGSPGMAGLVSLMVALVVAIIMSAVVGALYGFLLNRLKGSEMTVSTYVGFSTVALMNIAWLLVPFKNGDSIWPVGGVGLRNTINLSGYFAFVLNDFLGVHIGGSRLMPETESYINSIIHFGPEKEMIGTDLLIKNSMFIPTGLIIFFLVCCLVVWLFLRTRTGTAMSAAGANPVFAKAAGINTDKMRVLGTMVSTILGAVGIIVYSQSYGFIQLYNAPLMMSFSLVAAILIGGATVSRSRILNVIVGTFLFQGVLVVALPVANKLLPGSNLPDIVRIIISNGIILYALTRAGGAKTNE